MAYTVKSIFYTLQGEGANTGKPAVFLRFAGCNLWSGRERDRAKGPGGCSRWCDTDFVGTAGPGGGRFHAADALLRAVQSHWPQSATGGRVAPFVVCTGGEPLLQLDEPLLSAFNGAGWFVAAETNGTLAPPPGRLWLTVSPKAKATLRVTRGNELKLIFPQSGAEPERFANLPFEHFFLQPLDDAHTGDNTREALQYCLAHPQWRLSLQTHKLLEIP
ncbi:MAG TPA: 7-carboxy-7-deazaguanine synthase [Steroidobacteraceae bacterium]